MACFMLCLSFVPCGDGFERPQRNHEVVADPGEKGHRHDDEACTPFCTCSCCSVTISEPEPTFALLSKEEFSSPLYSFYTSSAFANVLNNIWQPPRRLG